jgi:hypothetical protein
MKTPIILAALVVCLACHADGQPLKLLGKTILICPIMLQDSGEPSTDVSRHAIPMAEILGIKLEQQGMLPAISPQYPESIMVEKNLVTVAKQLHALRHQWKPGTDYILFARFEGKQTEQGFLVRAHAVMTDATGRIVWSQEPAEFSKGGNMWPIGLCMELAKTLTSISDLKESAEETEPGPLETQVRHKREAAAKKREKTP